MALNVSQLGYRDGKLGELRDKHHRRGLVLPPTVTASTSSRAVARSLRPAGVGLGMRP